MATEEYCARAVTQGIVKGRVLVGERVACVAAVLSSSAALMGTRTIASGQAYVTRVETWSGRPHSCASACYPVSYEGAEVAASSLTDGLIDNKFKHATTDGTCQ